MVGEKTGASKKLIQIAICFPQDVIDKVDDIRQQMAALLSGVRLSRGNVVRHLVALGLKAREQKKKRR